MQELQLTRYITKKQNSQEHGRANRKARESPKSMINWEIGTIVDTFMAIHCTVLEIFNKKKYVLFQDFFKCLFSFPDGTTYAGHSSNLRK